VVWFIAVGATTIEKHPLAPANTDSPRTTLKSFIESVDKAYQLYISGQRKTKELEYYGNRAIRCLDLSKVVPSVMLNVGVESLLLLKEVLDRIEIPLYEKIPDRTAMKNEEFKKWVIPHTEITIALVKEGPRQGEYLFTADTIERLKSFYERVEHLPYKPGSSVEIYNDYIMGSGWMIPGHRIHALPQFFKTKFYEQAVWQWFGMLLVLFLGAAIAMLVYHLTRRKVTQQTNEANFRLFFRKMLFPLGLAVLTLLIEYLLNDQINITGQLLTIILFVGEIIFFAATVWIISIIGNAIAEWIISKPSIQEASIDANMIRIFSRVITIVLLFILLLNATKDLGISLTAVFASAGIVGLALALAARETIANFFGGISILVDRPFRTGDYIILDSGERGEVLEVGLRSTRIITRDDVQISIPNYKITEAKIINESVPKNRFRVRIKAGVAYGSDVDQVEELLLQTAKSNQLVAQYPEPRVRLRSFGDSALEFELLCWSYKPESKGKLMHQLNRGIYKAFNTAGIAIPFPQRDVHLIKEDDIATGTGDTKRKQAELMP
jgi:MscS family membrane protein